MNTEMLETVKAEIRRLVDEAEADIRVVRLDAMVGDNNADTYAAFRVIALEPINAAMIEFAG